MCHLRLMIEVQKKANAYISKKNSLAVLETERHATWLNDYSTK